MQASPAKAGFSEIGNVFSICPKPNKTNSRTTEYLVLKDQLFNVRDLVTLNVFTNDHPAPPASFGFMTIMHICCIAKNAAH
jgi:hypothetical protein